MFQPSQNDVRRFFCGTRAKQRAGLPLDAMESIAARWIAEHPEYDADLADEAAALAAVSESWPGADSSQSLAMNGSLSDCSTTG